MNNLSPDTHCQVCGAVAEINADKIICPFCKFEKSLNQSPDLSNKDLIRAENINGYFKNKYKTMEHGETFQLSIPVTRVYKTPEPQDGQVNFFRSKNIMFLLEQHGFQMVSRVSRYSTELRLVVRKV
ncbi:hypothetical protein [Pseudemcibacter aquimaris]|uniref:hypothetical protein n=1 Tax=Pseudemcibacter aquimaris TaxID=2857064 RepID=UPI002012B494|nr:hypothetical protein [Pseudemcibacter aquimaris]MCC3862366.1 hypothetical protein [Pseudemcibacter aquimaris]WDU59203.1 hypothetical protein KW060_02835 [Pseudemcibacter aquimaris]